MFRGGAIKKRKMHARCANMCIFLNFVGLPDQYGRGEIGDGVCAPGTCVVARGYVDSGMESGWKQGALVEVPLDC